MPPQSNTPKPAPETATRLTRPVKKALVPGEEVLSVTRFHPVRLLRPFLWLVVAAAVAVLGALTLPDLRLPAGLDGRLNGTDLRGAAVMALAALAGLMFLRFLVRLFAWSRRRIVLTSARIVIADGPLGGRVASLPLRNIADLRLRRSIGGRLLGYGRLTAVVAGRRTDVHAVPRPKRFYSLVLDAITGPEPAGPVSAEPEATRRYTSVMEEPGMTTPLPRAPAPGEGEGLAGEVLDDRYVLVRRIAKGGMGAVYEGRDERLGRRVAVKMLREELLGDDRAVARFLREARAVAALAHPNVAAVFDYGDRHRRPYIVMELVPGPDLGRLLASEGPLEPRRAAGIAREVLAALQHAHEAGIVHLDIKPGNVIVPSARPVKVTDFGIAIALGDSRLTSTGTLMGSAHYVSPEQVRGEPATPLSDVYSCGVLLYEMVTGHPPFEGESPMQIAARHTSEPVPPPSWDANVSPELDDVVMRATERDPQSRFDSALAMARALEEAVSPSTRPFRTALGLRLRRGEEADTSL